MKVTLTQKDWMLISAYLDGQLSVSKKASFQSRIDSDVDFNSAFQEIQYTQRLIKSLPPKRAPRNFTLSAQYEKKISPKWGLNRFFGLVSAVSGFALIAIFAWTNLFAFQAKTAAPAPLMAAVPEAAMDTSLSAEEKTTNAPMIITWGQQPGRGGGGGGGGEDTLALATNLGGYGGDALDGAQEIMAETEYPEASAKMAATPDPSTLILGLPEPGTEGEIISQNAREVESFTPSLPASTFWMIGLGIGALVFAVLAFILRRR